MKKTRVLAISTVHPVTDPRIAYKIIPALSEVYEVFCALPGRQQNIANVVSLKLPKSTRLIKRSVLTYPVLLFHILRIRPKIVHLFVPELIPLALLVRLFGTKVIYEIQENLYKKFSLKRYNNAPIFQLLFQFFDALARRYFHCIVTEDAYLEEYNDLQHKPVVIYNYPCLSLIDNNTKPINATTTPSLPIFFYCGVISFERCFDVLIAALYNLKSQGYAFKMLLFGPVRFSEKEANQLPNYGTVLPHLEFFGYTDLKDALAYTSGSLAGLALLKPVGDYMDSYTTKLFEYMATALPVLTSDFPLYKKIIEPAGCGFCISPNDPIQLSEKLAWLIQNPEQAVTMGEQGRRAVENLYSWETEKIKLLKFYEVVNN